MTAAPLRWVDRSRITADWKCSRARYLNYEFDGTGITADVTSIELFMGTVIHDALAAIAEAHIAGKVDIDTIATAAGLSIRESLAPEGADGDTQNYANEQACLVEGMIRGFYRHVWPRLMAPGWKVIAIEREVVKTLGGDRRLMSKPDLILEDPEGSWHYVEYKSTSYVRKNWVDSWQTAVQLHSGCAAVEETLGTPVTSVLVQGLYKGYESYGRQNSPFCYVYVKAANPPFSKEIVSYEYQAGYRRVPVWERPGGIAAHVAAMPEEILTNQFPQVPPIFIKQEVVDRFLAQTDHRERQIQDAIAYIGAIDTIHKREAEAGMTPDPEEAGRKIAALDETFPQSFDQCDPFVGRSCQFKRLCHGQVDDPLTQGFQRREPHHTPEREQWVAAGMLP